MEINLRDIVWPVCVIQCNEALTRLEPGEDLTIIVSDPDVADNIVLLINSRPDLRFRQHRGSRSYRLSVHRLKIDRHAETDSIQGATE